MEYETFQKILTTKLTRQLGDDYRLILQKVPKNNGLILDSLSIRPRDQTVAPTIYLNHYYERFQEGVSIENLIREILDIYQENSPLTHVNFSILEDFSQLKDKVIFRLIHAGSNQELLADIPFVPYLDLAVVFYLHLEQNDFGQMTALIHRRHMELWNTSPEELYALARINTQRLLPADIKTMAQVIKDMAREHLGEKYQEESIEQLLPRQDSSPMYVLSNSSGINGASAMLYPCTLEYVADTLKKDLVILPSSIHEVLLIPYDEDVDFEDLSEMVATINREQVPLEDRLSNHVYFYSRTTKQTAIAPGCVSPGLA